MEVRVNEIYRHYTGSFYTVLAVTQIDVGKGVYPNYRDIVVLRKLSSKAESVTYYLEDFLSEVDEVSDVMGQKFKFVRVKDAQFSLAETTTEALVEELKKRSDNPYAKEGDPKVYEVYYEIGVYKPVNPKYAKYKGQQYFDISAQADTVSDALNYIKKHFPRSQRPVVMKVVRREEFTVQEILTSSENVL